MDERVPLPRKYRRIKVKGHNRAIARDSSGRFKKVKKWSGKKKR